MHAHLALEQARRHARAAVTGALPTLLAFLISVQPAAGAEANAYRQTNLVSDLPGLAQFTDANLKNPWGLAHGPTTPWWVSDNGTGVSTLYRGNGQAVPLVVTIPAPPGSPPGTTAAPTGVVFNDTDGFMVSQGGVAGPSRFLFATEDGTLAGWNPTVDPTHAILAVDNSNGGTGAVYKGLARGQAGSRDLLFATNFRAGTVDVFDAHFAPVERRGAFRDPLLPAGYAPFGIQNIAGKLYVTFALQDSAKHDDVKGPGHGFVDVFDTRGHLLRRLISRGQLDSPWGLVLAPEDFGAFSGALLVGNFGDGRIHAYTPHSGAFLGTLRDQRHQPITIDGLWALEFGNGGQAGPLNTLFFTAGLNDEADGLLGTIEAAGRT
jgi:uncharacterized protein (TIGR03118 family)